MSKTELEEWRGLQRIADKYQKEGLNSLSERLELFLSPTNVSAQKVRQWFRRNAANRTVDSSFMPSEPLSVWEKEVWLLKFLKFDCFQEMGDWEKAPKEGRTDHSWRVAKLARELADALEKPLKPYYPPVLALFDNERAVDLIRSLQQEKAENAIQGTGYLLIPEDKNDEYERTGEPFEFIESDYQPQWGEVIGKSIRDVLWLSPSATLSNQFLSPSAQRFPSLLRRLAAFAEYQENQEKRDKRTATGDPDARVFARELAEYFENIFQKVPYAVVAACVCLKFPRLDPCPDGDVVRKWCVSG